MDLDMEQITCGECGIRFAAPSRFFRDRRQDPKLHWYCPNGHWRHYAKSEADKLREERDRLKQQLAEKDDRIKFERDMREHEERRVIAAKGQITKLKKRAQNGVCPCCSRTFVDLQRHMKTKHPAFEKEPDAADNVVKLKTA